jgi:Ca2+-binding EF-hand superfamily protein
VATSRQRQIRPDPLHCPQYYLYHAGEKFNASDFKEFKLGYKTKDVILKEFLNLVPISPEGYITQEEFFNFYTDLSINIPSDQAYSDFVSGQWGVALQKVATPTAEEVKSALKNIRFKLLQRTNGTHEEFILRKIFSEFDVARRGKLNEDDLSAMLTKLEIPT